ncbi:MAG: 4-hydroxybenzoyl-CoA thioesterase [Pseudonocardiales bacterium]|jgi:acyl-CoA thioester hydrolase|nr:4-hydroxybenzoyl-CoA thioesterase [Pseudonocardiales bacterium]
MKWERTRMVYFGDDDSSGLIYFPSYFQYMSEGDQEVFAAIGYAVPDQVASGITAPTVHVECDYFAPARAGDVLTQRVVVTAGEKSSVTCEHEFHNGDVRVARGRIVRAFVDLDSMRTVDVPDGFRAAVSGDGRTA